MTTPMDVQHRGGSQTAENYKLIPVHAAPGVHAAVAERLMARVKPGARVVDMGAGQGALAQRLHDCGFEVIAIDVSDEGWSAPDVRCHVCDLDGDWKDVLALGPFDAVVSVDVIEHLENPRDFLRKISKLAGRGPLPLVVSTPNPLDTFSSITMFTRGIFNWFSPAHYNGGGHISILPYWLLDKHLEYLGSPTCEWSFHSNFRHRTLPGRIVYAAINRLRRLVAKSGPHSHFDGEAAVGVTTLNAGAPPTS